MRMFVFALTVALAAVITPPRAEAAGEGTTDQQIAQQIADRLTSSGQLKGYSIAVKYKNGVARLDGWVRNEEQMGRAMQMVNNMPEVANIDNQLAIRGESPVRRAVAGRPEAFRSSAAGQPLGPQPAGGLQQAAYPEDEEEYVVEGNQHAYEVEVSADFAPLDNYAGNMQVARPVPPQPQQRQPAQEYQPQQQQQQQNGVASRPYARRVVPARVTQPVGEPLPGQPEFLPPGPPVRGQRPLAMGQYGGGAPLPAYMPGAGGGVAPAVYDQPNLPNYAWPSYAPYPNYAALTYPRQYSPAAWPYIGPFYPYPQVPLGWRKVTLEWDDGWWFLDFQDDRLHCTGR